MKVYIINGFGGSGKDTFENMVKQSSKTEGYKTSMVEIVKHYAEQMGWEGSKEDKDRKFLSDLKDALEEWADIPFAYVISRVQLFEELNNCGYCFVDAREPKDINRLKSIDVLRECTFLTMHSEMDDFLDEVFSENNITTYPENTSVKQNNITTYPENTSVKKKKKSIFDRFRK